VISESQPVPSAQELARVRTSPLREALDKIGLPDLHRNLFSSPEWMSVLERTYGLKLFVKYIEEAGRIRSYVLYSVVHNFLEEKICVCSYCDYCDCPVASLDDWRLFFYSWRSDFPDYRIAIRCLRDPHVRDLPELGRLDQELFHLLDVRDELDLLWKRAHDSFKAAVNQARRKGVTVRVCSREELKCFYSSHLSVRKNKYRIFPQPFRFFQNIWDQFVEQDQGVLLGAFDPQGRFIGGNIYLICGRTLYYKFNTSRRDALHWRPNNILFWEGICYAKARGLTAIDLGSSGETQTGLIRFKDHVGAQKSFITHLGFAPSGYKFSRKRILSFLTRTLTAPWVPDAVLRWGSDIVYHHLA